MPARVAVLGGGVGGTLVANLLDKALGREARVSVIDPTGMHHYQPGYLYVALGQANGRWLVRDERSLLRRDVDLIIDRAVRIHPDAGTVQLERGASVEWDYLVIATGARLMHDRIPGLVEGAFGFYSLEDAQRLREELRRFRGGRILVGIGGIPYKCPPAPVEFVFMLEEYLRKRGVRDRSSVTLLSPLNRAFTIESASKVIQPILEERGIELTTFFNVEQVDPAAHTVTSIEGEKAEYDLLVLVPPHQGQSVVIDSDLGDPGGWLPTDRLTLQVKDRDRIFAMGDANRSADQQERFDRALRGAGRREQDRFAGAGERSEDQLRRSRHVLPGDGEPQGDGPAIRLRTPAHTAEAQHDLARGEVDVQQGVLGDGAPGSHPRGTATAQRRQPMSAQITRTLDLKGLSCPLPIVKTAQAIRELQSGDLIEALATDPGSVPDFEAWCTTTGNELVEQSEADAVYRFVIRKK